MKINEVIDIDNDFSEIKNILMFLKSKGINQVPIKVVIKELSKRGLTFSVDELIPIISDLPIVADVNNQNISLNGGTDEDDIVPEKSPESEDEDFDMNKEKVKQMAKSSRIRRDRR